MSCGHYEAAERSPSATFMASASFSFSLRHFIHSVGGGGGVLSDGCVLKSINGGHAGVRSGLTGSVRSHRGAVENQSR